jgi:hypothetical protein
MGEGSERSCAQGSNVRWFLRRWSRLPPWAASPSLTALLQPGAVSPPEATAAARRPTGRAPTGSPRSRRPTPTRVRCPACTSLDRLPVRACHGRCALCALFRVWITHTIRSCGGISAEINHFMWCAMGAWPAASNGHCLHPLAVAGLVMPTCACAA